MNKIRRYILEKAKYIQITKPIAKDLLRVITVKQQKRKKKDETKS